MVYSRETGDGEEGGAVEDGGRLAGAWWSALCLVLALLSAHAAETDSVGLIASLEPGWPQWRGPRRDGISDETDLLQSWPEGGPKLLWTATGLGTGWSSPIVTGGSMYITGDTGPDLTVFALDMDGQVRWRAKNGAAWKGSFSGARACCAYSEGHIYHMNAHGRIACFEAATGREVWAVNALERFQGQNITWAISECVLVDGPNVIVTPGGRKAFMAALNKKTGQTAWAGEALPNPDTERTGYASPILLRFGGRRLLVTLSLHFVVCVDADTGKVLWTHEKRSRYDANCATPVFCDGGIFQTAPSGSGGLFLKLQSEKEAVRVEKLWECRVDNISGGAVARDGFLYSSGHRNTGWVCMAVSDGKTAYDSAELAQGSLLYADGRLYCLSERGVAALVKPGPQGFEILGRFQLTDGRNADAWEHPVVVGGRLYLRYHGKLQCYDVRR
ncbi:MAG: PQQ-binding-like beta-propeller repeat protein [Planctomycetota bacterium]|nr:PQQ-binding-like beta-propeller repeat protein [Planctomycetota bacterium]